MEKDNSEIPFFKPIDRDKIIAYFASPESTAYKVNYALQNNDIGELARMVFEMEKVHQQETSALMEASIQKLAEVFEKGFSDGKDSQKEMDDRKLKGILKSFLLENKKYLHDPHQDELDASYDQGWADGGNAVIMDIRRKVMDIGRKMNERGSGIILF